MPACDWRLASKGVSYKHRPAGAVTDGPAPTGPGSVRGTARRRRGTLRARLLPVEHVHFKLGFKAFGNSEFLLSYPRMGLVRIGDGSEHESEWARPGAFDGRALRLPARQCRARLGWRPCTSKSRTTGDVPSFRNRTRNGQGRAFPSAPAVLRASTARAHALAGAPAAPLELRLDNFEFILLLLIRPNYLSTPQEGPCRTQTRT